MALAFTIPVRLTPLAQKWTTDVLLLTIVLSELRVITPCFLCHWFREYEVHNCPWTRVENRDYPVKRAGPTLWFNHCAQWATRHEKVLQNGMHPLALNLWIWSLRLHVDFGYDSPVKRASPASYQIRAVQCVLKPWGLLGLYWNWICRSCHV